MNNQDATLAEIIFVPKYRRVITLFPILLLLSLPICIYFLAEDEFRDLATAAVFLMCYTGAVLVMLRLPRQVRFTTNELVVKRLFGRREVIPYAHITDIAYGVIKVRDGRAVILRQLQNQHEFQDLLNRLAEKGLLPVEEFKGSIDHKIALDLKLILWVTPVAIALGMGALWLGLCPNGWDANAFGTLIVIFTLALSSGVAHFVRRGR
jgi:hypothetical protein